MKKHFNVRMTNDCTGEVCEKTWYNCGSKFRAIRKMSRLMKKHIKYFGDFDRIEVWEVSK